MSEKFSKGDLLYMRLTTWLLENFMDVYEDYILNAYEEHSQAWVDYKKGEEE
tara:strand:- start:2208 stop:2363 length:156 start_codon:yes stop_codon:yes gene_type:complete